MTEYPGQRFVFEKKFSIEVEKGSLEEKYQHLLQPNDADEDDEKDGVVPLDLSGEFMQINGTFVRVDQVSTKTSDNFQNLNFSKKFDQSNYGYNYNPQNFYPYYNPKKSYQSGQPNFQGYQMSNQRYHNLQYQQNQMNKFKQLPQQNLHQQQPHQNHKIQEHQLQQQQHQDQLQFQVHQKQEHQQQQFQPQKLYYQQNQDVHLHHQILHEQQPQDKKKLQYHNQQQYQDQQIHHQQQQFQHQQPQQYQLQHQYNEQQYHDKQSQQHQSQYQEPKPQWNQQQRYDNSYFQSYNYYNPYYYYSFNPNLNYHLNRNNQSYYIRQFIGTTTRKPIDEHYELLPKSYLSLGAKIQHVIVNRDDDGNKVKVPNADEDSLEVLAPFDPFEDDNEFITEILMSEEIVKLKAKLFQDFLLSKNTTTKSNTTKNPRRTTRIPMRKFQKSNLGRKISDQKMNEMKRKINEKRIQIIKIQKTNRKFNSNLNWRNYALHTPSIRKHIGTATTQRTTKLTTTITATTKPTTTRKRIISQEKPMRSRGKRPKFLQIKSFPLTNQDQINILSVRKPLDFCSKPVYLKHDCQPKILVKIWSYNKRDKRCYQYEDECAHLKENAFATSMECFYNCWSP